MNNFFKCILSWFFVFIAVFLSSQNAFCKTISKDFQIETKDARVIKANLSYLKIENAKKYPTVLLLHSLGYSSENWGNLADMLVNSGYAVIKMDLRGHGKSVYDANLKQRSWQYFTNKVYQKFPSDVVQMLSEIDKQSKKTDLNRLVIIGADIGANTAILVSKNLSVKPKALVLISPTMTFKGLYVPIALSEIGYVPVLAITSQKDSFCLQEQQKLSRFSQGAFYVKNYPNGGMGMLMIKVNPAMSSDIVKWVASFVK
ncbi:MAG TPA: alpha/beta fold hydrolase [Candidatus Gastranaerophilaceae bacterium]|nr:alpha/beta fold hydrolase [Candidatus Gastranaerophilaceae bacterium]HPT40849.1 alpha/beta fold hydrolase [Candidatus Gastranaerophilaceae bacterium]